MRLALALGALALFACDRQPRSSERPIPVPQVDSEALLQRVNSLENDVRELQLQGISAARLRPSDNGAWQQVDAGIGSITVAMKDVSSFANGSRVRFQIGNPTSARITRLTATLLYGEADEDGASRGQTHRLNHTFSEEIPAGAWRDVTVNLDGVPPPRLGYVTFSAVMAERISLALPR